MGMRIAVGASRGRLIRQLLAESLLLGGIGATLGALLARNLSNVLVASLSTKNDPLFVDLGTDWRVFGFTTALTVVTCILFGLAPALRATSVTPGIVLRENGRGTTPGRSRFGLRRILVVSQIALSLTLLVGALLFARSLNNLAGVDAGFRQDGILVTDIDFSTLNLPKETRLAFSTDLFKRIRELPGVNVASIARIVPLSGDGINHDILMGDSGEPEGEPPVATFNVISPGFFATLQTQLLGGRDFDDHDTLASPNVAIVNEAFAKKFAKSANPLGAKFRVRRLQETSALYEVVGFVRNTKYGELREDFQPIVYTAIAQNEHPDTDAQILIRSNVSALTLISALKSTASAVNPNLDLSFFTFHEMIENGLLRDRLMARLSGFFGLLAVLLAVIGLYAVISYMIARRRSEIAIRMAMGADRRSIAELVLREASLLLGFGLIVGTLLALAGAKAASFMLFGLKPWDVTTFAFALSGLSTVGVAASLLPAMRAARMDPMTALRDE
jgi:predicted permease